MKRLLTLTCLVGVFASAGALGQTMGQPEVLNAGAIDINNGRAGQIVINIDRWSTPSERTTLTTSLTENGPDGLLREMQKQKSVGRIRTPDSIGYDLRFSQERKGVDGGRDVVLVTDRPISFWEMRNRPRSIDYPFTLIQLHLGADGKGEGKLAIATKIIVDPDTKMIEIEDFAHQPVNLVDVSSEPKKNN